MTKQDLENRLNAAYEIEKQAKKVAHKVMNQFIREYIITTSSNSIEFTTDDSIEYHLVDSPISSYEASKLNFTYTDQDYIVTVTSNYGETHLLTDTDISYNLVSDIILCELNEPK